MNIIFKFAIVAIVAMAICSCASAQVTVKGKVLDEEENPIPGVNIVIKGTQIGAATDADGKFSITKATSEPVTLVVSFAGYQTIEITTEQQSDIVIQLGGAEPDSIENPYYSCMDHKAPNGPHVGKDTAKLTKRYGCQTFKEVD